MQRLAGIPVDAAARNQDTGAAKGSMDARHVFANSPHKRPNHCLVNEYLSGQGILPHEDGPAYYPITATVSLGSYTILDVKAKSKGDSTDVQAGCSMWRVLCEPRSLLITTDQAYVDTLHGIREIERDEDLGPEPESGMGKGIANWDLLSRKSRSSYEDGGARRATRLSLTYRDVLKVKSLKGIGFLQRGRR